jgi:hypothetical protein
VKFTYFDKGRSHESIGSRRGHARWSVPIAEILARGHHRSTLSHVNQHLSVGLFDLSIESCNQRLSQHETLLHSGQHMQSDHQLCTSPNTSRSWPTSMQPCPLARGYLTMRESPTSSCHAALVAFMHWCMGMHSLHAARSAVDQRCGCRFTSVSPLLVQIKAHQTSTLCSREHVLCELTSLGTCMH